MADKKRSPKLVALAVKLYDELHSTQKVAKRLELGVSTTHRLLKAAGVVMPDRFAPEVQERKKSLHGDRSQAVANEYADGVPLASIRRKYGVGTWAIRTAAKDCGVALRANGGRRREFSDRELGEMARLYQEDQYSQGQIAAEFNTSVPMVNRLLRAKGIESRGKVARGKDHGSWNGGRVKIGDYMAALVASDDPLHCMAHRTGYVLEHRLVMARALGRALSKHETVHHIDGDTTNNKLGNLQLRFGKHGSGVALKCRCCGSTDIIPVEL